MAGITYDPFYSNSQLKKKIIFSVYTYPFEDLMFRSESIYLIYRNMKTILGITFYDSTLIDI